VSSIVELRSRRSSNDFVGGGQFNIASQLDAFVGGCSGHTASGQSAFVGRQRQYRRR
jgi:hypothetical protein